MIQWMLGNAYSLQATLYENNITLNSPAAAKLNNCRYCMVGLDSSALQLVLKAVPEEAVEKRLVPMENLNKVFFGKGYARISNKYLIQHIAEITQKTCAGEKFPLRYDDKEQLLIIDLQSGKENL